MYRLIAESFAGKEFRAVFCPLSTGRQSHKGKDDPHASPEDGGISMGEYVLAPPGAAGGEGGSGLAESGPLVKALESVKRTDSDLAERSFSRKASETVRRLGVAAEHLEPNRRNWAFCTLTWPTGTPEGMRAIAANTPWIVQSVKNHFRSKVYAEKDYLYVWERQRRGTLHLHWLQRLRDGSSGSRIDREFRTKAHGLGLALSARAGVNVLRGEIMDWSDRPDVLRNEAQIVRKSVSRYLSKYVSKGVRATSAQWAKIGAPSPRRWWGASVSLKEKMKSLTVTNRADFTTYRAAANSFAELIDISMLRVLPSQCRRRYLSECSGEVFTLFSNIALCGLTNLWKKFAHSSSAQEGPQSKTQTLRQQCLALPSPTDVDGLLAGMSKTVGFPPTYKHWASQTLDSYRGVTSGELNSGCCIEAVRRWIRTGTELLYSKSASSTNVRMKLEAERQLAGILSIFWSLSKSPATLDSWLIGTSVTTHSSPPPTPVQGNLFG